MLVLCVSRVVKAAFGFRMSSHVAKAASDAVKASNILARLRGRMESVVEGGLAAYITPSNDAHHVRGCAGGVVSS